MGGINANALSGQILAGRLGTAENKNKIVKESKLICKEQVENGEGQHPVRGS